MLAPLLQTDPASPRLTVYDDARGVRMEFSAQTLDNWANKVANLLDEELEVGPDSIIYLDLPVSWQSAVIALGAYNASQRPVIGSPAELSSRSQPTVVFTTVAGVASWPNVSDCVVVSDDPFGRGVVESGGQLPTGTVDFGPTVRFYGDQYFNPSPDLQQWNRAELAAHRYWVQPWSSTEQFERNVLGPLAADGSVVFAVGLMTAERIDEIVAAEKVTHFLTEHC